MSRTLFLALLDEHEVSTARLVQKQILLYLDDRISMRDHIHACGYCPGTRRPAQGDLFSSRFSKVHLLTWFGIVRSMDFLSGKPWKLDADGSFYAGLVSSDHHALCGDKT